MSSTFTLARAELEAAYDAAGLDAYTYTPPTVVPPIVTILPASSWITPNRVGHFTAAVELTVTAYVSLIDSSIALEQLEQLVEDIITATPSGVLINSVDAPRIDATSSQGELLASDITITAQVRSN